MKENISVLMKDYVECHQFQKPFFSSDFFKWGNCFVGNVTHPYTSKLIHCFFLIILKTTV